VKEVMPKLNVLTAGATPPNPVALLESKGMATLLEDVSQTYDFVIVDAPPLLVAADALTLGRVADGVLMVARPGVVNSHTASAAKDLLTTSAQKVLGLVINGVILENESDSYYYYIKEYYMEEDSKNRQKLTSKSGRKTARR
jgi:capsular exopolysaccharide synthesis family protein